MMAQLRGNPHGVAPAKLVDTARETWVSEADEQRLAELMSDVHSEPTKENRERAAEFCALARDWRSSFDDLLDAWAEERRSAATSAWCATVTREVVQAQNFPPYTAAYARGL